MVVPRFHRKPTQFEIEHMLNRLVFFGSELFDGHIDRNMRKIRDHWHAHWRPNKK